MLKYLTTLTALVMLAGCGEKSSSVPDSSSVQAGEALFKENCVECHPRTGRGDYLKRIPATLLTRRSQYQLMKWIEGTDQHREMPSFDHLSESERASLADYLYTEILK